MNKYLTSVSIFLCLLISGNIFAKDLGEIREKGYIEIAVYESFPPFSYKTEQGNITGIDVDLGREIARLLGVQAGFRLFQADESVEDDLRNVVWKGHYLGGGVADMMLHVPIDPNFAKQNDQVTFLTPYYKEEVVFAINPVRTGTLKTLEIFQKEKIGVEGDSLADVYLLSALNGKLRNNVVHYKTVIDASNALVTDELTAVMANRSELENGLNQLSDRKNIVVTKLPTPGLSVTGWDLGAAVKASHSTLAKEIAQIIDKLRSDGTVARIFADHGITYNPPINAVDFKSALQQE